MRLPPISRFLFWLIVLLSIAFWIHSMILQYMGLPEPSNMLLSYVVNGLMAAFIYIVLYAFRAKLKNHIGFLFMGGSFLKFAVFFIVFYPVYHADGVMDKIEFAAFFVPYGIALALETIFMAQMLKNMG